MKLLFKIWDSSRSSKKFVSVDDSACLLDDLISNACQKFGLDRPDADNKFKLVLEADGTDIDKESVAAVQNEVLLLLREHEVWQARSSNSRPLSPESTMTNSSENSSLTSQGNSRLTSPGTSPSVSESTWVHFNIPWEKISNSTMKAINSSTALKSDVSNVVHTVVDAMIDISGEVPMKAFHIAAHKLVAKYPKIFQDFDDDGVVIGSGIITIFNQLKERYKYRKVCLKRKHENDLPDTTPITKRKKLMTAKAGCADWQPATSNAPNNDEDKNYLKTINFEEPFDEDIVKLLENTYPEQRKFLNRAEPPTIKDVRGEWPILLTPGGIRFHFKKLMDVDINLLIDNMLLKAKKILKFGLHLKVINKIPEEETQIIKSCLKIITKYFSENAGDIYLNITDLAEIEELVTPRIVCIKQDAAINHFVVIEKEKLNDSLHFKNALMELFCIYFNFNLEYPKAASLTLEFLQTYFLKIHPQQGAKNTKNTRKTSQTKIISLLNKLKKF